MRKHKKENRGIVCLHLNGGVENHHRIHLELGWDIIEWLGSEEVVQQLRKKEREETNMEEENSLVSSCNSLTRLERSELV